MKKIAILGSTGSIGTQTVDILPSIDAEVVALTTNRRINLLEEQARALHPKMVCAMDESAAKELKIKLADTDIEVLTGMDGLIAWCRGERRGHRGNGGCRHGRPAADDGGHQGGQGHCAGEQGDARVCGRSGDERRKAVRRAHPAGGFRAFGYLPVRAGGKRQPDRQNPADSLRRSVLRQKNRGNARHDARAGACTPRTGAWVQRSRSTLRP